MLGLDGYIQHYKFTELENLLAKSEEPILDWEKATRGQID
jgi:hypothetical protein